MSTAPDIEHAARTLRDGGVVAFPTETVYGLGANALNPSAVARIFEVKGRPRFDPLIVHVADVAALDALVTDVPESARKLIDRFWPGSLTVVLHKKPLVPDIVTAGLPTVAVRVPDHPIALDLIRRAGVPIAAPSANRFGGVSPTTAQHVRDELGDKIDAILDGGPCRTGVESTVISFTTDHPRLLRPGGVPREEIEAVIGSVEVITRSSDHPESPGMIDRHYAPRTRMMLGPIDTMLLANQRVGLLSFKGRSPAFAPNYEYAAVETLSSTGDLREAAANLFAAIRRLDAAHLELIIAEPAPNQGLGLAINDRLRRATALRRDDLVNPGNE